MKLFKVRGLLAILAALPVLLGTPQAFADHAYQHGWWGQPPVVISDGNYTANVQDAAYYWQDRGFDGYYPPLPQVVGGAYCANDYVGYITVCTIPRWVLQPYCPGGGGCDGDTQSYFYNGTNRVEGAFILVADDLTPYRRQQVWRHEFGHAIGLGHTNYSSCVMNPGAFLPLGETCYHDITTVRDTMYPGKKW